MQLNVFFKKTWKTMLINGLIALLFGILFLFTTNDFVKTLISWIGIALIAVGIVLLCIDIYKAGKKEPWGVFLLQSIVFLIFGVLFILYPQQISTMSYIVFGIWIAVTGTFQLITTIQYRKFIAQSTLTIVSALLLVILGLFLIFYPNESKLVTTKIIGSFLLVTGLWQIFNAFRFKRICKRAEEADIIEEE